MAHSSAAKGRGVLLPGLKGFEPAYRRQGFKDPRVQEFILNIFTWSLPACRQAGNP